MQSLSSKLYEMANPAADDFVADHRRRQFLWIWFWIFINQSAENIENELNQISTYLDEDADIKPEQLLHLSWKAEALEQLLG